MTTYRDTAIYGGGLIDGAMWDLHFSCPAVEGVFDRHRIVSVESGGYTATAADNGLLIRPRTGGNVGARAEPASRTAYARTIRCARARAFGNGR